MPLAPERWQDLQAMLSLVNPQVDANATRVLRSTKLRAARGVDFTSALIAAGNYSSKQGKPSYVYKGNSFMNEVFRVATKKSEALSPINNTGGAVYQVDPDLTVTRYGVVREEELELNPRKRAPFTDGPRGTERELAKLRRDQDLVQQQLAKAYEQGNTKAIERLRELERDLDRRVDELAFGQTPNGRAVLAPDEHLESRQVLGGAYRGRIDDRPMLTHSVVVRGEPPGDEVRVLCRQPLDHIADYYSSSPKEMALPPTCPRCRDKWDRLQQIPNASSYYVWVLAADGTPKDEGPYGPKPLEEAKQYARIAATNGAHDRAVSRGLDPQSPSFEVVRRYKRGTGESVL